MLSAVRIGLVVVGAAIATRGVIGVIDLAVGCTCGGTASGSTASRPALVRQFSSTLEPIDFEWTSRPVGNSDGQSRTSRALSDAGIDPRTVFLAGDAFGMGDVGTQADGLVGAPTLPSPLTLGPSLDRRSTHGAVGWTTAGLALLAAGAWPRRTRARVP